MSQSTYKPLHLQGGDSQVNLVETQWDSLRAELTRLMASCDPTDREAVLAWFLERVGAFLDDFDAEVGREVAKLAGPRPARLTPEQLDWARQQFDEEVSAAGVREIEATGGIPLQDVLRELQSNRATP